MKNKTLKQEWAITKSCSWCKKTFMPETKYGKKYFDRRKFCGAKCATTANQDKVYGNKKQSYSTLHGWLLRSYGSLNNFPCSKCGNFGRRTERALIKGREYSRNEEDYIPLCPSCHRKYDMTEETKMKIANGHRGKPAPWKRKQFVCDYCERPHRANGVCSYHYQLMYRYGKRLKVNIEGV